MLFHSFSVSFFSCFSFFFSITISVSLSFYIFSFATAFSFSFLLMNRSGSLFIKLCVWNVTGIISLLIYNVIFHCFPAGDVIHSGQGSVLDSLARLQPVEEQERRPDRHGLFQSLSNSQSRAGRWRLHQCFISEWWVRKKSTWNDWDSAFLFLIVIHFWNYLLLKKSIVLSKSKLEKFRLLCEPNSLYLVRKIQFL